MIGPPAHVCRRQDVPINQFPSKRFTLALLPRSTRSLPARRRSAFGDTGLPWRASTTTTTGTGQMTQTVAMVLDLEGTTRQVRATLTSGAMTHSSAEQVHPVTTALTAVDGGVGGGTTLLRMTVTVHVP